jgi:hypothetical protein
MPPATRKKTRRLTDAQLEEMLALTSHADSVELKLTVPDSERRSTVTGLGMDPLEAQIRQVFFFDTPDLALNKQGVVVRARRVQGRGDDTVVKLRPIVPDQLPPSVRKAKAMVVEVDAMPGGYVCSASFKATPSSRSRPVTGRSASCTPRSSGPSTPPTPPRGWAWTTCRSWGRSM